MTTDGGEASMSPDPRAVPDEALAAAREKARQAFDSFRPSGMMVYGGLYQKVFAACDAYAAALGSVPAPAPTPHMCPVCNGAGHISRPPHVAGDVNTWFDNSVASYPCRACSGSGVIWAAVPVGEPKPARFGDETPATHFMAPRGEEVERIRDVLVDCLTRYPGADPRAMAAYLESSVEDYIERSVHARLGRKEQADV